MTDWRIFHGTGAPIEAPFELPEPPPWRCFGDVQARASLPYTWREDELDAVNAALMLRRPLLITGPAGCGKSSLAYAVAHELRLGKVLVWPVRSRSQVRDALYEYDAIARLRDANLQQVLGGQQSEDIGRYIRLGPLGTALATSRKNQIRVLLIDEFDKGDVDLPDDLLHVLDEGRFTVPELQRHAATTARIPSADGALVSIEDGRIECAEFPLVVITSNDKRSFSPAFLRRTIRLRIQRPDAARLGLIIRSHLASASGSAADSGLDALVEALCAQHAPERRALAVSQFMEAVFLITRRSVDAAERARLEALILRELES